MGDYKLHQYFENGDLELYNLKDDLGETKNLAETMPEKTQELLSRLEAWRKEIKAPVPTKLNPAYDAEADAAARAGKGSKPGGKKKKKKA